MVKNNLTTKRIYTILRLKAIGINDKELFSKIYVSNSKNLNKIINKHLKFNSPKKTKLIEICIRSYIKTKHDSFTKQLWYIIDDVLRRQYGNNKGSKNFQDLIDFTMNIFKKYKDRIQDHGSLRQETKDKYILNLSLVEALTKDRYFVRLDLNNEIRRLNELNQKNLHTINELNDMIIDFNHLVEKYQNYHRNRTYFIRTKQTRSSIRNKINNHAIKHFIDEVRENHYFPEFDEILKDLRIIDGKIVLPNKEKQMNLVINNYKDTMYRLHFGFNQSDKQDKKNTYYMSALPFDLSGRIECGNKAKNNKDMEKILDEGKIAYFTAYTFDLNQLFNSIQGNERFTILDFGCNTYRKQYNMNKLGKYFESINYASPSAYEKAYSILDNVSVVNYNALERKMKYRIKPWMYITYSVKSVNEKRTLNAYFLKLVKVVREIKHDKDDDKVDISFNFDYKDSSKKTTKYNQYLKEHHGIKSKFYQYKIFLPNTLKGSSLYDSFGHPCVKEITKEKYIQKQRYDDKSGKVKIKELREKLGNIKQLHLFREQQCLAIKIIINYFDMTMKLSEKVDTLSVKNTSVRDLLKNIYESEGLIRNMHYYLYDKILKINEEIAKIDQKIKLILTPQRLDAEMFYRKNGLHYTQQRQYKELVESYDKQIEQERNNIKALLNGKQQIGKFIENMLIRQDKSVRNHYVEIMVLKEILKYFESCTCRLFNTKRYTNELLKLGIKNLPKSLYMEDQEYEYNNDDSESNDIFDRLLDYGNTEYYDENIPLDLSGIPMRDFFLLILRIWKNLPKNHVDFEFYDNIVDSIYNIVYPFVFVEKTILTSSDIRFKLPPTV